MSHRDYVEQYRLFHARKASFNGTSCLRLWREIVGARARLDCKSALDFGCAKGEQYRRRIWSGGAFHTLEELLAVPVTKYDPAIPAHAAEPAGQFDLVICVDVLNCMPASEVPRTVARLYELTRKVLLVGINQLECGKYLPNGLCAVQNYQEDAWWEAAVVRHAPDRIVTELHLH